MNNAKDFLAKEPLGKLLMRLALPTVAAQLINMLYNIVDRMYIGHIPDVGALALTGVGVCMPLIMIVSAFAALVGNGGAPRASIFMGKGAKEKAEKTLGNCFTMQASTVSAVLTAILLLWNRNMLLAFGASDNTIEYAVQYMIYLFDRYGFCTTDTWYECIYHSTGICKDGNAFRSHRRRDQYCAGSDLYFRIWNGSARSGTCDDSFSALLLYLGTCIFIWKKDNIADQERESGLKTGGYLSVSGSWFLCLHYAGKRERDLCVL